MAEWDWLFQEHPFRGTKWELVVNGGERCYTFLNSSDVYPRIPLWAVAYFTGALWDWSKTAEEEGLHCLSENIPTRLTKKAAW